jgi:methionyl-tRNA formyltransferase
MRIIFAGTPEFAARALAALIAAGHTIPLVLTQPDRPAGRGMKPSASAVKQLAVEHGLAMLQPASLKDAQAQAALVEAKADVMVVAAYGLLLPQAVLDIPRHGCLNIHASLLPRWRGAAPIQRALLAGDGETGITIMQMDAGLDTGAMLQRVTLPIDANDTAQTLHDKLAALGAEAIVEALQRQAQGGSRGEAQNEAQATYAAKLHKSEALLDWNKSAAELERAVRAYNPFPVASARLNGETIKIWRAKPTVEAAGTPGEIVKVGRDGILVRCGEGALLVEEVQKAGGKRLAAAQFLAGNPLQPGQRFEA